MPDPDTNKRLQIILYGAIMSVLAAMVTALLNEGAIWSRVRTFIAGVCCGILLNIILLNSNIEQFYKDIICTAGAAFVSTVWPILGRMTNKYLKKKSDDIVQDSKPD